MASRRTQLISAAAVMAIVAGGYGLHWATAQSAPPELSQTPMNITNVIKPALIMAVDDSGSMDFETVLPTNDGSAWWDAVNDKFVGFDRNDQAAAGVLNFNRAGGATDARWKKYPYLFPFGAGVDGKANIDNVNDHFAIPPTSDYGWARSPDVNKAYFDPEKIYDPWIESTGRYLQGVIGINSLTGQVDPENAPADPKRGTRRLKLTADFAYTGTDGIFMFQSGMTVPSGTRYQLGACGNGGAFPAGAHATDVTNGSPGWPLAQADRKITGTDGRSRCAIAIQYYPATFYVLKSRAANLASTLGYLPASITDIGTTPDGLPLSRFEIKLANFSSEPQYQSTIDNFANWFSYYRKRHEAVRGGISLAFGNSTNSLRAGYFTINARNAVVMRDVTIPSEKEALFDDVFLLKPNGGTPNKEAVQFMGAQFERRAETNGTQPILQQCQRNIGMLFTDGFSNQATTSINTNVDGSGAPFAGAPFADAQSGTMADIAAHYYKTNLRSDLPTGKVPVPKQCSAATPDPRLDCQTNPHMNFYGITLGAKGLEYGINQNATSDPYTYPPAWPTAFYDRHPSAIDDIWHAALNSRGEYINAQTPSDITAAVRRVLAAANDGETPSGTIGVTGARIGAGSLVLQPRYESANNGTDWYGRLTAETVTTNAVAGNVTFTTAWEASAKLATLGEASRNIQFGTTGSNVVPAVRAFDASNLSFSSLCSGPLAVSLWCNAANIQALDDGNMTLARAVAYLRGSRVDEGVLRTRTGILGDIVNSSPVLTSPADDYGYRALGGTLASSYTTFLASKKTENRPLAIVGANDGMLHVFDGRSASPGGEELYAYIPATSIDHMGNLLFPYDAADKNDQKFKHTYFVDGPITISDAYIGGAWRTIAVGTSGAGGRSVFALDITNPAAITILWEVNNLITGDTAISNNIGHVLGKPVIVPVKSSAGAVSWKVIFGNGYNSANQQARLFVVDAASGAVTSIAAVESTVPAYNGLGSVSVIDRKKLDASNAIVNGRDGYSDTVYAADQNGAVWKFDLLTNSVAFSGQPLFVARDAANIRQPILGGLTAAAGPSGGVMLYFGTGSFSFTGDTAVNNQQTIYGIFDNGAAISGRGALLQQAYGTTTAGFRTTSNNAYIAGGLGWYLDLPISERFVGNPRIESGIVFFPTYEPNTSSATDCSVGGTNWLYGLKALNGGAALSAARMGSPTGTQAVSGTGAVALTTEGSAAVKDVGVFTSPRLAPLGSGATEEQIDAALGAQCSMVIRVAGAPPLYLPRPCGRQSWRQVR
jgi:type IV pilus assembly protein PilY1